MAREFKTEPPFIRLAGDRELLVVVVVVVADRASITNSFAGPNGATRDAHRAIRLDSHCEQR